MKENKEDICVFTRDLWGNYNGDIKTNIFVFFILIIVIICVIQLGRAIFLRMNNDVLKARETFLEGGNINVF